MFHNKSFIATFLLILAATIQGHRSKTMYQRSQSSQAVGLDLNPVGKESICNRRCRRLRFHPCVRKIPWRKAWQPTPVFLSAEFHGQRSLVSHSQYCHKESDTTEETWVHTSSEIQSRWVSLLSLRLGQEDSLKREMATHSSILVWEIPRTEKSGELHTVHGVAKSQTCLSD